MNLFDIFYRGNSMDSDVPLSALRAMTQAQLATVNYAQCTNWDNRVLRVIRGADGLLCWDRD